MKTVLQKKLIVKLKEIRKDLVETQTYLKKHKGNKNSIIGYKIHYINAVLDFTYGQNNNDGCVFVDGERVAIETIMNIDLQRFIKKIDSRALNHLLSTAEYLRFKQRACNNGPITLF